MNYGHDREKNIFNILLIEDNKADIRLTREVFKNLGILDSLHVVSDGEAALDFLFQRGDFSVCPRPNLILLDLNIPKIDGQSVLSEVKSNSFLTDIPVIILTTSSNQEDMLQAYRLHANAYIVKPISVEDFQKIVEGIRFFWIETVAYPAAIREEQL